MIVDSVKNCSIYKGISPLIDEAIAIMPTVTQATPIGRYEVDGANLFYTVMEYTACPEIGKKYEFHKNYIDIQQIIVGQEAIVYQNIAKLQTETPYDPSKDIGFMAGEGSRITLDAGEFMLLFAEDAHKPGIGTGYVKKVVFKVKIS